MAAMSTRRSTSAASLRATRASAARPSSRHGAFQGRRRRHAGLPAPRACARPEHQRSGDHRGARDHHHHSSRLARDRACDRVHHGLQGVTRMDGIELEIVWSNLISIVSEQAKAMQRIAFSPIVREAGDLANALFDRRGRMVAQAVTGTPGHINSLAAAGKHFVEAFPTQTLEEGDVLITNDPWLSAGHFFDITVLVPAFHKGKLVGFFGSTIHHTDIGGYGVGAGARDVHEEGLWIPMLKLYERGEPNKVLHDIIRRNVRTPNEVFGDLAAQVSSGKLAAKRLSALLDRQGYDDIETLSDEIISRSEAATRQSIRKLKAGTYHGESAFDVPGGDVVTLKTAVTVDPAEGTVTIDFTGSSGQSPYGINVVMNYTHAYSTFAIRSCLNPDLPNNYGSLAPIKVIAPEGSIVKCQYQAPVKARHVGGMYVS